MDPFTNNQGIGPHPSLPPLRLVNRRTQEHVGPCPFCGGSGRRSDRFHLWLQPGNEHYWCRACGAKGRLSKLLGDERPAPQPRTPAKHERADSAPQPQAERQGIYRQLYEAVALWAHANLLDDCNPDPLTYLHKRGLTDATVGRYLLGTTMRDPKAMVAMLRREAPGLLDYGEEAGLLISSGRGELRTHPNLCGALVFPYMANGQIVDLRARSFPGKGYRSLPGGYSERGAVFPLGWEDLGQSDTVLITEGEIKALAVSQAYHEGRLDTPALAHPGLAYFREEWPELLRDKGVRTVVLGYDSQPRRITDGTLGLASEEIWTLRHGERLASQGLEVRVLRLPLERGEEKSDLDVYLLKHRAQKLQHLIDLAPSLHDYRNSLPRSLLSTTKLVPADSHSYPLRRSRPQRLELASDLPPAAPGAPTTSEQPASQLTLDEARSEIAALVRDHSVDGQGFLVLAHPPGTGKGHNTMEGLRAYLQAHQKPGAIVWTGLRKEQIHDQKGIPLTPLSGRNNNNCRKIGEAQALAAQGYNVRSALCQRRCPFVDSCAYLAQFRQEADVFASQDLLQATGWWETAGVLVLDEFDPSRLVRSIPLDSAHLARMGAATTCPHARTLLRWLGILLGSDTDRTISGTLLLGELEAQARAEGLDLSHTLLAAAAALPPEDEVHLLRGLPHGATVADYAALPPNYLSRIITQLNHEQRKRLAAMPFSSRLEVSGGRLLLHVRLDHLIAHLGRPEQPKIILDATANEELLRAIFPNTPLRVERPAIAGGARVIQVISRDWAKSTLQDGRWEQWYEEVSAHIRPGRPTLVICTQACEANLKAALSERGHTNVVVAHYGAVRGSNAYKGHDVVLAQIYNPNLEAVVREGRALFADEGEALDERMVTTDKLLTDATGARWVVQVPTFADKRLAALLAHHREAELVQAALRGRPLDHPDIQITLLFSLPLDNLPPTEVREAVASPKSNGGREQEARQKLAAAAQELLAQGTRAVSVEELVAATRQSPVTVRKHLAYVARLLGLRLVQQRRLVALPRGGKRTYQRMVLLRRGRRVPPRERAGEAGTAASEQQKGIDQARKEALITRLIYHQRYARSAPSGPHTGGETSVPAAVTRGRGRLRPGYRSPLAFRPIDQKRQE